MNNFNGKTCLVTGASGFIGAYLCRELLDQGAYVKALVRKPSKGLWQKCYQCNLGSEKIPKEALESVDIIFHLAGFTHSVTQTKYDKDLCHKVNVEGTRSLLIAAKDSNIDTFIYFSSVKAIGEESEMRLDEDSIPKPQSIYGKTKLEAEKLVLHGMFIKHPVVLRLVMVYGCTNKGNFPRLIKAISNNWFPPFPKIVNKRSMIHVEDVIQGATLSALSENSAGKIYILCDGIDYSTRLIYENICHALNKNVPKWGIPILLFKLASKFGDLLGRISGHRILFDTDRYEKLFGNSFYSSKKATLEIGFKPKHNLIDKIPEIIESISAE